MIELNTKSQLINKLKSDVRHNSSLNVWDNVRKNVRKNVKQNVWNNVWYNVWNNVWDNVGADLIIHIKQI